MTVVGEASILIRPVTTGFEGELKKQTDASLVGFRKDAEAAGAEAGAGLRGGVTKESGKLAGDLEKHGNAAGAALSSGVKKGLLVVGAAAVGAAASAVHLAESMQSADASIAAASGTSVKSATAIGNAFLDTAGKSEFSGEQMAKAYAGVAGQLKATEGHALNAAQASKVMAAADDLATAKQIDLGTATSTLASVMQAFHLKTTDASHASDVLFSASTATGQSVDALGSALARVKSRLGDTGGSVGDLSALLVDMTNQGITGRGAMGALNTSMTTLQRTASNVSIAQQTQQTVLAQMPTNLRALAEGYAKGEISQKDYSKATRSLSGEQRSLMSQFTTAQTAIQTAQIKYQELGVTVFNAQGKFVGMGSIIDQLHPKFAAMTQAQQLAAATTLFGAGAAKQMTAVIDAGPAAYDKATSSVNRMDAAHNAAAKQAGTLHVQEEILKSTVIDLGTKIGAVLIPAVATFASGILHATNFVMDHKAVLIALAAVVTGVLGTAIAVFTVNKMAKFGNSFVEASGHVKTFVGDVQTGVGKVMDLFSKQSAAADDMATKVGSATKQASGAVDTEATNVTEATGTIEADNAKASTSFTTVATDAEAAQVKVGAAETTMVTEVTAADSTIEAENAAAKASFAGIGLGAAGIAAGGLAGMGDTTNLGSSGYQNAYNFLVQGGMSPAQAKAQLAKQGIRPPSGGGGAGGSSSVGAQGAPPILGSSVANQLLTMLQMEGLSKAGAAGIVGNAAQESNFNPNEPGGYLFQWLGSRLTGEQAFAASQGLPASNVSAQVGFVMKELQGMPGLLHMLQTTNNPQAAALAFSNIFERPNAALANNAHRESAAAQAYASPSAGGSVRTRGGRVISAPAYVNPLAHAQGVTQGRTDQGVDYTATPGSPIDALGSGKIVDIVKNWFKGQPLIEEQLTSGPDKGKFVYYAEQLHSLVKQGQSVKAGQQIARVAGSGTGLEIGYGAPGGRTLAQATTGYTEGRSPRPASSSRR